MGPLAGAPRSRARRRMEVEVSAVTGSRTHAGPAGMMAPPASDQLRVKVGARFTVWDAAAPCEAVGGEKKKKVFISLPNRDLPSNAFCNGKGGWYGSFSCHMWSRANENRRGWPEAGCRLGQKGRLGPAWKQTSACWGWWPLAPLEALRPGSRSGRPHAQFCPRLRWSLVPDIHRI